MGILLKAANGNTVVTTGWTNPANAQTLQPDNTNATAEPAVSSDIISDFTFPAILDAEIPVGSTINSVSFLIDIGSNVLTGANMGLRGVNNGVVDSASENVIAAGAGTRQSFVFGTTPSLTDVKTAGRLGARVRASKGATAGTLAAVLDDVVIAIDYTPPADHSWTVVFSKNLGPAGGVGNTGRSITIPSLSAGDVVCVSYQRSTAGTNDIASDTISDNVGNDYTAHRINQYDSTDGQGHISAIVVATNGGTNVVVSSAYAGGTSHSFNNLKVLVLRFSGGTPVFDKSASTGVATSAASGADNASVGPVTPAVAGSAVIACFENEGGGKALTAGTSPIAFLTDAQSNSIYAQPGADGIIEHTIQAAVAAITPSASVQDTGIRYTGVVWVVSPATASQFSRPSADTATGGWTRGGTDSGTLFGQIDETTASDTDYITATAT